MAPDRASVFAERRAELDIELDALDEALMKELAPLNGKCLYVYHPAWGYFCDAYGLTQVAVEIEGKEPSDHELTRLHERIRADGAKVIFVQPQISSASVEAVAKAVGARVDVLDPMVRDIPSNLMDVARRIKGAFDE